MSVIRRMSAAKHLWMLKRANSLQPSSLLDVKQKLVALGPPLLPSILELLPHPQARPHAEEILGEILSNQTVGDFVAVLSVAPPSAMTHVIELLSTSEKYDAALLLELFPSAPLKAKASLEAILQRRAKSIPFSKLAACLGDNIKESRSLVYRLLELTGDPSAVAKLKSLLQ